MRETAPIISPGLPVCIGVEKTCYRCGQEFLDFSDRGLGRVCTECKKPRVKQELPPLRGQALTVRERQIAALVAEAKPSKEIAYQLHLAVGSIKTMVSTILSKTGMANRTALAVWWVLKNYDHL